LLQRRAGPVLNTAALADGAVEEPSAIAPQLFASLFYKVTRKDFLAGCDAEDTSGRKNDMRSTTRHFS
jgi:hypothetical protein